MLVVNNLSLFPLPSLFLPYLTQLSLISIKGNNQWEKETVRILSAYRSWLCNNIYARLVLVNIDTSDVFWLLVQLS